MVRRVPTNGFEKRAISRPQAVYPSGRLCSRCQEEKNIASLTTINIHFSRPHEPRRAEPACQGAHRAPWTRPARQNNGNGHNCKGLHAQPALLAADTTPSGYRLNTDIAAARAPSPPNTLRAPHRAAESNAPPRARPWRPTRAHPRHTMSLEGGTYGGEGAGGARGAPACPQSVRG
jgi:hypothetical protein